MMRLTPVNWFHNADLFLLGGYESVDPWWIQGPGPSGPTGETFYSSPVQFADVFAGEWMLRLSAADASQFEAGDAVFIRSREQEDPDHFTKLGYPNFKFIPIYTEINEVVKVNIPALRPGFGEIQLRYSLRDD